LTHAWWLPVLRGWPKPRSRSVARRPSRSARGTLLRVRGRPRPRISVRSRRNRNRNWVVRAHNWVGAHNIIVTAVITIQLLCYNTHTSCFATANRSRRRVTQKFAEKWKLKKLFQADGKTSCNRSRISASEPTIDISAWGFFFEPKVPKTDLKQSHRYRLTCKGGGYTDYAILRQVILNAVSQ